MCIVVSVASRKKGTVVAVVVCTPFSIRSRRDIYFFSDVAGIFPTGWRSGLGATCCLGGWPPAILKYFAEKYLGTISEGKWGKTKGQKFILAMKTSIPTSFSLRAILRPSRSSVHPCAEAMFHSSVCHSFPRAKRVSERQGEWEWEWSGREGGGNWGGDMAVVSCRCHKDLKMMKGRKEGRKEEGASFSSSCSLALYIHTYVYQVPRGEGKQPFGRRGNLVLQVVTKPCAKPY